MGNLYHSDVHLPRWKRVALWLVESETGAAIWGIPLTLLVMLPVVWIGIWWPLAIVAFAFVFAFGWNCARRSYERNGRIDRL